MVTKLRTSQSFFRFFFAACPFLAALATLVPMHAADSSGKRHVYPFERPDCRIYREFFEAFRGKDPEKSLDLVLRGVNINVADEDGNTALILAAREGNLAVFKALIERGADINAKTNYHYDVFRSAITGRNFALVSYLVSKGVNVNETFDSEGTTPLMEAAHFGLANVVSLLIANGAEVNARSNHGYNAMIAAAEGGHPDVIALLTDHGADLNHIGNEGMTPLMWAALAGHLEAVTMLVEKGAKVDLTSKPYGETALALASESVSKKGTDHLAVVKYLLQHGASPSIPDKSGMTPLMIASVYGRVEVMRLLVAAGADIHSVDGEGAKAFRESVGEKRLSSLQTLLDLGANPNWKLDNDYPALLYAVEIKQDTEMVAMLVKAKADVNVTRKQGIILSGPAGDLRGPSFYTYSVLIGAVREGALPMVKLLLQAGADKTYKDSEGQTALDVAGGEKDPEVIRLLTSDK